MNPSTMEEQEMDQIGRAIGGANSQIDAHFQVTVTIASTQAVVIA